MAIVTKGRLQEEIRRILGGGSISSSMEPSANEVKIAIGQVANALLKIDYFSVNAKIGETIPNGAMLGTYEDIPVEQWKTKSRAALPIKPIKLPRNMGVWSVFANDDPSNEFIPEQLGQEAMIVGQSLLSSLITCGYTVYGKWVEFAEDITLPSQTTLVGMRLIILDMNEYGDYDPLPILPEMEFEIKKQVLEMYGFKMPADKLVNTNKEQTGVPIQQQNES